MLVSEWNYFDTAAFMAQLDLTGVAAMDPRGTVVTCLGAVLPRPAGAGTTTGGRGAARANLRLGGTCAGPAPSATLRTSLELVTRGMLLDNQPHRRLAVRDGQRVPVRPWPDIVASRPVPLHP